MGVMNHYLIETEHGFELTDLGWRELQNLEI